MGKCWLLVGFGIGWESQEMRTQICEAVKCWLLKMRVESGGGWWGKVGESGGMEVVGGVLLEEPKRRQRLRARWVPMTQKYSIFI